MEGRVCGVAGKGRGGVTAGGPYQRGDAVQSNTGLKRGAKVSRVSAEDGGAGELTQQRDEGTGDLSYGGGDGK